MIRTNLGCKLKGAAALKYFDDASESPPSEAKKARGTAEGASKRVAALKALAKYGCEPVNYLQLIASLACSRGLLLSGRLGRLHADTKDPAKKNAQQRHAERMNRG